MKKVLITGKNSYIGTSVEQLLLQEPEKYIIDTIDMRDESWKEKDFSKYDVIFHVAAVVHHKERSEAKKLYFKVNRDLPIEVAIKAKEAGVNQFIFMSTMAVYGIEGRIGQEVIINRNTPVNPKSFYGLSKLECEMKLNLLSDENFNIVILRPPMVYGRDCPGNYAKLEKFSVKSPIFPLIQNKRSMLHIDKLCQFVKFYIDNQACGLFLPQDKEYVNTSLLVKNLAEKHGKTIHLSSILGVFINIFCKRVTLINKIFGNLIYEKDN